MAPFLATWLATEYGVGWVGVYLAAAAALTFVALLVMRETKDTSLDSEVGPPSSEGAAPLAHPDARQYHQRQDRGRSR